MPLWSSMLPFAAIALLVLALLLQVGTVLAAICVLALVGAVISAVHHAEVVAHRVGEPFGTLVLAIAVTIIEVALIVSLMLAGGPDKSALPRETIFSSIMIICNGVLGLCLLLGGWRHHEQRFQIDGANTALATLIALSTLSLVLPAFTTSSSGSTYSMPQLTFAALASLVLWGAFVFIQTVRHRDYFLPVDDVADEGVHALPPTSRQAWMSFGLLLVALVAVVGLAKILSPSIEAAVAAASAPPAVLGIVIAMIVLMPEAWAAARAALANRIQTSLNLAFGSAIACIGLTIPAVILASVLIDMPLALGLEPKELVLLVLTYFVTAITLVSGRTHLMQGVVHLVLFAAFLFLAFVP